MKVRITSDGTASGSRVETESGWELCATNCMIQMNWDSRLITARVTLAKPLLHVTCEADVEVVDLDGTRYKLVPMEK